MICYVVACFIIMVALIYLVTTCIESRRTCELLRGADVRKCKFRKNLTCWNKFSCAECTYVREDIKFEKHAIHLGYTVEKEKRPGAAFSFILDQIHIWETGNGWIAADLIDDHYTNHRKYYRLMSALETEHENQKIETKNGCPTGRPI